MTYVADPRYMKKTNVEFLLSDKYAEMRAKEIGEQALTPKPCNPDCGGTVYMCAADGEGNMILIFKVTIRALAAASLFPATVFP